MPYLPWTSGPHDARADADWVADWRRDWDAWQRHILAGSNHMGGVRAEIDRLLARVRNAHMRAYNLDFHDKQNLLDDRSAIDAELRRLASLPSDADHDRRAQDIHDRLTAAKVPAEVLARIYKRTRALRDRVLNGGLASSEDAQREWRAIESLVHEWEARGLRPPGPDGGSEPERGAAGHRTRGSESDVRDGEADRKAILDNLPNAARKAIGQYEYACEVRGEKLTDAVAWGWLKKRGEAPACTRETWERHLRTARRALGEQKHRPRARPTTGRTIVRARDLD